MRVFVSYRRQESERVVSRLCSRLDEAFGPRNVFYDERSVATGGDFLGTVVGWMHTSDVILVVIGPNWATVKDSRGRPRIFDEDDPVRWEVSMAIGSGRQIIPLLVEGAGMPSKGELPAPMRDITTRSGMRLGTGARFDDDVDELIRRLGGPTVQAGSRQFLGSRAPRATSAWTSFEGHWQTRDGGWAEIVQDGDQIEFNGSASNGASYQGRGQAQGGYAVVEFVNSFGLRGRIVMQLVQNGAYINGQVQTHMGVMPFDMMRRI